MNKRVLILAGGSAGANTALHLERRLAAIVKLPTLRSPTLSEPEGPSRGGAEKHQSGALEHSESRQ